MTARCSTLAMVRSLRFILCLSALAGCSRTTNLVSSKRASDGGPQRDAQMPADSGAGDASDGSPPFTRSDAGVVLCGELPCACANGLDDDGDGLIDGFDGECTGPYDQDESSFATGEGPQGNPNCRDCFFDGNPSAADDDCRIATACLDTGSSAGAPSACSTCMPSATCVNRCLPRTPNGCDCFGCCEVELDGSNIAIKLVDTCALDELGDEERCPRCQLSSACKNECGRCELCPGKTLADLPADCATGSGPGFTCDNGTLCRTDGACGSESYCVQGCCVPFVL